jgi:phospholipase C
MKISDSARSLCRHAGLGAALLSTFVNLMAPPIVSATNLPQPPRTLTPIKHVIVIIGENRTFDHVYATYRPRFGEFVSKASLYPICFQNASSMQMAPRAPTIHVRPNIAR